MKAEEIREDAVDWTERITGDIENLSSELEVEQCKLRLGVQQIRWQSEIAAQLSELNNNLWLAMNGNYPITVSVRNDGGYPFSVEKR